MEGRLTLTQVLEITTEMLEGIEVPMKLVDTIGIPVANAIKNLKACIDVQKQAEAKFMEEAKAKHDTEEAPVDGNAKQSEQSE